MNAASLTVQHVDKRFGGVRAVDDVSFTVPAGEALGLVGPNGAGKTTMLNCINGLLQVDAGQIFLDQHPIENQPAHHLAAAGVARTFQIAEHFKSFSAVEFVMLGRTHRQIRSVVACAFGLPQVRQSEAAERALALAMLDRFGLVDLANERLNNLPYGVQKRVDIARAMAAEPRMLLLDEPTSGVSPIERQGISEALGMASDIGVTRLVVDHDVAFVTRNCSRIVVMDYGRVIAFGDAPEVLAMSSVREAYLGI